MVREPMDERLSRLATHWTLMRRAQSRGADARAAQEALLSRYRPVVERYLRAVLRDPHAADDLTQEFCLKFVRGDFHKAEPSRGRFRDYVKTVLFHLVGSQRRQQRLRLLENGLQDAPAPAEAPEPRFEESWRQELLARAFDALQAERPVYHAVLRLHVENPEAPSVALAHLVSRQTGMPVTGIGVRQTLHRARKLFARLLSNEVADSLQDPLPERIAEELCELDLWKFCQLQAAVEGE